MSGRVLSGLVLLGIMSATDISERLRTNGLRQIMSFENVG